MPIGCQLITAYVSVKEYKELCRNAERIQSMCAQHNCNLNSSFSVNVNPTPAGSLNNSSVYPFQFKKKLMKRDKSLVFTNIPEESCSGSQMLANGATVNAEPSRQRPNHLPLRFKNITSKDIPESGFSSSIAFDEYDSFPQFIGRTSVCSTPMTENKVLQGNILPICANKAVPDTKFAADKAEIDCNLSATDGADHADFKFGGEKQKMLEFSKNINNSIVNPYAVYFRRNSLLDVREVMKKHPMMGRSANGPVDCVGDFVDESASAPSRKCRTITDPMYPVFSSTGVAISRFLFEDYVDKQRENDAGATAPPESGKALAIDSKAEPERPAVINNQSKQTNVMKPLEKIGVAINNINRKALSLPLKSLSNEAKQPGEGGGLLDKHRKATGIQLTPLITKLSILAMSDDRGNGFSGWDATPGIEVATPIDGAKLFRRRSSVKTEDVETVTDSAEKSADSGETKKVELFICGQNNMTMLLLMEEGSAQKQDVVHSMVSLMCLMPLANLKSNRSFSVQHLRVEASAPRNESGANAQRQHERGQNGRRVQLSDRQQ